MQIQFRSRHGLARVILPQLMGHELGAWTDGQVRDVPDDLSVPVRMSLTPGSPTGLAKATDVILKSGPDFIDVDADLNPDFRCSRCGTETLAEWFSGQNGEQIPYEDEHGERLCVKDYLLEQGRTSYAWRYHSSVEHGAPLLEAEGELDGRDARDAETAALTPAASAASAASAAPAASVASAASAEPLAPAAIEAPASTSSGRALRAVAPAVPADAAGLSVPPAAVPPASFPIPAEPAP